MTVAAVHRVCTRSESLALLAAVRSCASLLSVHHVGCNRKDGQCRLGVLVNRELLQLAAEEMYKFLGDKVHAVVIIAETWILTIDFESVGKALFVTVRLHLGELDGREGIRRNRQTCNAIRKIDLRIGVDERHLRTFVIVFVMHVVDDVHRLVIYTGHLMQDLLVIGQHLIVIQFVALERFDAFHHDGSGVLAPSAVQREQQCLRKVRPGAEELNRLAYSLIRYTACDTVILFATDLAHQVVIFILHGTGIYGNLAQNSLNPSGRDGLQSTVMFGSGAGPRL